MYRQAKGLVRNVQMERGGARAFARHPGRRSALFVWHGAEERGLLGSRWHAGHPVVPRASIVAVINADMLPMEFTTFADTL